MGRGKLPLSKNRLAVIAELGASVAEAVLRRDYDRARQLAEEVMQVSAGEQS